MFIFHFHNIFVVTFYVYISVIDTFIHFGRIKMLHKHTHLPLCVLTACGHWTLRLNCLWSAGPEVPQLIEVQWLQYGDKILDIIGSGIGLSSFWCQPLPEPMMIYFQLEP